MNANEGKECVGNRNWRRCRCRRGTTLVEVLMAVTVFVVCIAIAGPITIKLLRMTGGRATLSDQLAVIDRVNEAMRADAYGRPIVGVDEKDRQAGTSKAAVVRVVGEDRVIFEMADTSGYKRVVGYLAEKGKIWRVEKVGDGAQRVTSMWRLARVKPVFSAEAGKRGAVAVNCWWEMTPYRDDWVSPKNMWVTLAARDGRDRPIEMTLPKEKVVEMAPMDVTTQPVTTTQVVSGQTEEPPKKSWRQRRWGCGELESMYGPEDVSNRGSATSMMPTTQLGMPSGLGIGVGADGVIRTTTTQAVKEGGR